MRLLFGRVDDRDVGHAVALALTHEPVDHFAAFNIMADSGLTDDDVFALDADVTTALEQRWPGVTDLARERGVDLRESIWGRLLFPVNKAKSDSATGRATTSRPSLKRWRRGDSGHYPYADEPWWGVKRPVE